MADSATMGRNTGEGIYVSIRVRPLNDREIRDGQQKAFNCHTSNNSITSEEGQTYYYDKVFDESTSTVSVYNCIAKDVVKGVTAGINGTIFAYGQTSSGKTHTMLGSGGEHRGVLEMAAEDIFFHIANCPSRDFLLRVSFVEIYNENIRDLLSECSNDSTVAIREDPRKGVYCEASEIIITDFESIIKALKRGIAKRAVESTAMNDTSSRSHTIFKLVVESKESARMGENADGSVLVASLNLVDLAGSESVRHTGATGQRAKEGGKINQSLLSLSRVIHALSQPGTHVSFRDSKLTRLLQPSLSGNAKMSVVCCITPAEKYIEETRSTLQFASRAKLVTTDAKVNEILDESAQLKRLKKELDDLKEKQHFYANNHTNGMNDEEYSRLESEKEILTTRLNVLQKEKEKQSEQLDRLRELIVSGGEAFNNQDANKVKRRNKKFRDTWCPGDHTISFLSNSDVNISHTSDESFSSSFSTESNKENENYKRNDNSEAELHKLKEENKYLLIQLKEAQEAITKLNDDLDEANKTIELPMEVDISKVTDSIVIAEKDKLIDELQYLLKCSEARIESEFLKQNDTKNEMEVKVNQYEEVTKLLQVELSQAKTQIENLNSEVSHAEELLMEMEKEHEYISNQLQESVSREVALSNAVQEADNEAIALREQVLTIERQLEDSIAELHYVKKNIFDEQSKRDKLLDGEIQKNLDLQSIITAKDNMINELQIQNNEYTLSTESLKAKVVEFDNIHHLNLEKDSIINNLQNNLNDFQVISNQTCCQYEMVNKELLEEKSLLQVKLDNAIESRNAASNENVDLLNKNVELTNFLEKAKFTCAELNERYELSLQKFSQSSQEMQFQYDAKVAELNELTNLSRSVSGYSSSLINNYKGESEITTEALTLVRRDMERVVESMRTDLGIKENEVSQLMTLNSSLQDRLKVAEQAIASNIEKDTANSDFDELRKKKLSQLQTTVDLLKSEKETMTNKINDLESSVKALSSDFILKEENYNKIIAVNSTTIDKYNKLVTEKTNYTDSIKALEVKVLSLKSERDDLKSDCDKCRGVIMDLELKLENLHGDSKISENRLCEVSEMERRLKKQKEEILLIQNEYEKTMSEKSDLNTEVEKAMIQIQELTDALIESTQSEEKSSIEYEMKLKALSLTYEAIKEERDNLSYQISKHIKELTVQNETISQLRSETIILSQMNSSNVHVQQDSLINDMNVLLESKLDLENQLHRLETVLSETRDELQNFQKNSRKEQEIIIKAAEDEMMYIKQEKDVALKELADVKATIAILHDDMEAKDKRISHLETCKLTKEQLDKIKTLKEERKKFSDDSKVMKKQLIALKKAYDELKLSSVGSTSHDVRELSDLKVQVAEVTGRLETSQHISNSLKDKLKECSKQLQEYEIERNNIIVLLNKHGVDTTIYNTYSDDTNESNIEEISEDVSIGIKKMIDIFTNKIDSLNLKYSTEVSKYSDNSSKVSSLISELDMITAQKNLLEKRLENVKSSHNVAANEVTQLKTEIASLQGEVMSLKTEISKLQNELAMNDNKLSCNNDTLTSEIQCLEEENIELMKENKELRKDIQHLRAQIDKASIEAVSIVSIPKAITVNSTSNKENVFDSLSSSSSKRKHSDKSSSQTPSKDDNDSYSLHTTGKKRLKAKALVAINNTNDEERPGECAQQ